MPPAPLDLDPSESTADVLAAWRALVAAAPKAVALIEAASGRVVSRAELNQQAEEWLHRHGEACGRSLSGQRVAFALPNGAEWMSTFLGLLKGGAVPLPLDSSEPVLQQRELARQGGATYLLAGDTLEQVGPPALPASNRSVCLVKLTSGSTGTPKPLAFTGAQMIADGRQVCASMDIRPEDLNLAIIPFGHSYGLGNIVMPLLIQGTGAVCVSAPLPHAIAADLQRWLPTVFPAVPALLRILTLSDLGTDTFRSLRVIISAGSVLPAEVARQFYEKYHQLVHGFYGSSETGGICYDRSGEATLAGRSVGTPLEGVTLRFSPGRRFWVESAAVVTRGHRHRAASGFGAHRPADLAELNSFGELELLGRAGRMMKIAGRRIDLAELERTLRQIEGLDDAFVSPHPKRPEELAAVVATRLTLDEARNRLRASLAAWKLPRRLVVVPTFPHTARGKVDTRALRHLLQTESG